MADYKSVVQSDEYRSQGVLGRDRILFEQCRDEYVGDRRVLTPDELDAREAELAA